MPIEPPGRRAAPTVLHVLVLAAGVALAACNDSKHDDLVSTDVGPAGGTLEAGPVRVTVPAGALGSTARLTVRETVALDVGALQRAGSGAYAVSLELPSGAPATLAEPISIEIAAASAPVHPEVGELARLEGAAWERIHASFWKPGAGTVVALTTSPRGTYRVVHRGRRLATGPAVARGLEVMLHETFGNEAFFGDVIGLQTVLNGVAPADAVALGAQVDLARVPAPIAEVMVGSDLAAKDAALRDPAVTRALIKAGAVVGVRGFYASEDPADDTLVRVGLTCALCHVNVRPTVFELTAGPTALPIGPILEDGVPNARMDAGKILSFTPFAQAAGPATVALLAGWGPNRFDVRALPDNVLDDGVDNPTDTPPLWNFLDLEAQGYGLGWDGLFAGQDALASQAEAVYDLVMHANGAFGTASGTLPPALAVVPPQALVEALAAAESAQPGNDVAPAQRLLDLQEWMRSIPSPAPGPFDEAMAEQGFRLFHGRAACASCHTTADLTGPGLFSDITEVAPAGDLAGGIRVPSLRGVSASAPYFHDDSAPSLEAAVERIAAVLADAGVALSAEERAALVEYLKSL